ncbi:hypothetical protein FRB99_001427 [Tulasnella sp. 403]|nr:hypothetical protein FRB99_001427 [Tulasnella sp. 403]
MNYVRGAFSAVTQYYTNLPPINASTLTGAIDVIVVETRSDDGSVDLACTPFHVRLGKWQVLRPGEKQVNVLVNGRPIPYMMKIGDAGEAFFVFETEEDVPEELMTSPILGPTKVDNDQQVDSEAQRQHATAGRFAAHGSDSEQPSEQDKIHPDQPSTFLPQRDESSHVSSFLESFLKSDAQADRFHGLLTHQLYPEPSFLDLDNGIGTSSSSSGASSPTSANAPDFPNPRNGNPPRGATPEDPSLTSKTVSATKSVLSAGPNVARLAKSVITNAPNTALDTLKKAKDEIGHVRSQSLLSHDQSASPGPFPDHVAESGGDPPDVMYKDDVVVDMAGYHGSQATAGSVTPSENPLHSGAGLGLVGSGFEGPPRADSSADIHRGTRPITITVDPSHGTSSLPFESPLPISSSHDYIPNSHEAPPSYVRGSSAPPELQVSIPMDNISTSPPEYEWEWGAFPTRSPARRTFSIKDDVHPGPSHLGKSVVTRDDIDLEKGAANKSDDETRDPRFGEGGRLGPDANDATVFWVFIEGRKFSFQLCLSSTLVQNIERRSKDECQCADLFERSKIEYRTLLNERAIAERSDLVMKWGDRTNYVKTLRLTSDQLKALELKKGANTITFSLAATGVVACTAKIFVWDSTDHVVVSDIDGTITKSDALGHMFNLIGRDWTHMGVAKLYTDIARNGYKLMYLTSRAIGQADSTRDYLKGIKQNNYQLPEGPVIMSPDRLMASLHREVIMRKPEVFKMACLRDIQRLFGPGNKEPFYAGFGNRITDALSYRSVNVPSARIFTIDSSGEVKMELLELAGYKSSYIHMTDLVDQMFPPVHRKWAPQYTDFNYWRDPIPEVDLPDLDPPSPALSAVSDTSVGSRLSRLRNFSLRPGSRSNISVNEAGLIPGLQRKEVSPSPLARSAISATSATDDRSTTLADSGSDDEHVRRGVRKLSFDSMPGSLPGSEHGGSRHSDEDIDEDAVDDEEEEEEPEEEDMPQFDDDILAMGEMESVPF